MAPTTPSDQMVSRGQFGVFGALAVSTSEIVGTGTTPSTRTSESRRPTRRRRRRRSRGRPSRSRLLDADDDVQLARALVDHADVDAGVRRARAITLAAMPGMCIMPRPTVAISAMPCSTSTESGRHSSLISRDDLVELALELARADHQAHGVDARRHVLEADAVGLEHGQDAAAEADLGVHQRLLDRDDREALAARDAGDLGRCRAACRCRCRAR